MELFILDDKHLFKREMETLFDLFREEEDRLIFVEQSTENQTKDNIVKLSYDVVEDTANISIEATVNQKKYQFSYNNKVDKQASQKVIRKKIKHGISYVWVQLLEAVTGKVHEWGILTGIRPTKLYHQYYSSLSKQELVKKFTEEYLIQPEKIELLHQIVERQLKVIPDLHQLDQEVSIYIGIPFCPTKCAYCTFPAYSIRGKTGTVEEFLQALDMEIKAIGAWIKENQRKVTTIYFGGGTPTSIEAEQLDQIFETLSQWIPLDQVREITVEAGRPDTITIDKINVLKKWNVDRISINPQTFTQETLEIIGRHHTVEETIEKFTLARKMEINNINMDLIIGLPSERLPELKDSLDQIEQLQPESLTIHTMAFKRASFLTHNKKSFEITEQEEIIRMMEYAKEWTTNHQYYPYYLYRQKNMLGNLENIGYALNGKESLYNILIMEEKQTIIGLGSGAASKMVSPRTKEIERIPNPKEPKVYIETIDEVISKKLAVLDEIFS